MLPLSSKQLGKAAGLKDKIPNLWNGYLTF
jgi:hypothetical protein